MAEQTMSEELLQYFTKLPEQDQREVISFVKTYVNGDNESEEPQTLEDYNQELEEADAAIERGEFVTHEEVMNHFLNRRK